MEAYTNLEIGLLAAVVVLAMLSAGLLAIALPYKNAEIEFIYQEWAKDKERYEKHIKNSGIRPPFPMGRTTKEGLPPIRPL